MDAQVMTARRVAQGKHIGGPLRCVVEVAGIEPAFLPSPSWGLMARLTNSPPRGYSPKAFSASDNLAARMDAGADAGASDCGAT